MADMTDARDPFDGVIALGYRLVPMEDFDDQVCVVDDCRVVLLDCALPKFTAARHLRELLGVPCLCSDGPCSDGPRRCS